MSLIIRKWLLCQSSTLILGFYGGPYMSTIFVLGTRHFTRKSIFYVTSLTNRTFWNRFSFGPCSFSYFLRISVRIVSFTFYAYIGPYVRGFPSGSSYYSCMVATSLRIAGVSLFFKRVLCRCERPCIMPSTHLNPRRSYPISTRTLDT